MFDSEIANASSRWGIPIPWIQAVIETESSWNPSAFNASDPGGSRGLMQISGPTAKSYGVTDLNTLFDPALNIDIGTHLLSDIRMRTGDDVAAIYSAYNSGNPSLYLTSSQVGANVHRFLANLQTWLEQEPLIATAGGAGGLIVALLLLIWAKTKKKG